MAGPDYAAELILATSIDGRSCFSVSDNPPFHVSSGGFQPVYVDTRRFQSMPSEREYLNNLLLQKIGDMGANGQFSLHAIAAVKSGGIDHASRIARNMSIPMITVSPKQKDHGLKSSVDGILEKDTNYLAFDDIIVTGESVIKIIQAIRKAGGVVTDALSIVDYGRKETAKRFRDMDVIPHSLIDLPALIEKAVEKGLVVEPMVSVIRKWQEDPKAWSRNWSDTHMAFK